MSNLLVCPGGDCPLRYTCHRFLKWLENDEDDREFEKIPHNGDGNCEMYQQKEFYGL